MAQTASDWVMGVGAGSCVSAPQNGADDLMALVLGFAGSEFLCPAGEGAYTFGEMPSDRETFLLLCKRLLYCVKAVPGCA